MDSGYFLTLVLGALVGGIAGWLCHQRFALKLERHGVRLSQWVLPFNPNVPTPEMLGRGVTAP